MMVHVSKGFFAGELIMVSLQLFVECRLQFFVSIFEGVLEPFLFFPLCGRTPIVTVPVRIEMVL
jgi:hypothetical protein